MRPSQRSSLLLALLVLVLAGCLPTSTQVVVVHPLPTPLSLAPGGWVSPVLVDLNTESLYQRHRPSIRHASAPALLGRFRNPGGAATITVYMTRGRGTCAHSPDELRALAEGMVWGPLALPAHATNTLEWERAAALAGPCAGALLQEVEGDGDLSLLLLVMPATAADAARRAPAGVADAPDPEVFEGGALVVTLEASK